MFVRTPSGRYALTPAGCRAAAIILFLLTFALFLPPYANFFIGDDFVEVGVNQGTRRNHAAEMTARMLMQFILGRTKHGPLQHYINEFKAP